MLILQHKQKEPTHAFQRVRSSLRRWSVLISFFRDSVWLKLTTKLIPNLNQRTCRGRKLALILTLIALLN